MFSDIDEYIDYSALSQMDADEKATYLNGIAGMSYGLAGDKAKEQTAFELLKFCVDEGCSCAAKFIVKMYDDGVECIDKASAEKYCTVSAFSGDSESKERLKKGFDIPKHVEKLLQSSDPHSRYELYLYYLNEGDKPLAEKYFSEALEMGDGDALYETYLFYTDKDSAFYSPELAMFYLKESASAGNKQAKELLKNNK